MHIQRNWVCFGIAMFQLQQASRHQAPQSKGFAEIKALGQRKGLLSCDPLITKVKVCHFHWLNGCYAVPTKVDLTRRPQVLGWLQLIFGPPAHLHVLCSIWAFLSRPKQNHKSGGANAVRLPHSFTKPQSSEIIVCMPLPNTWHDAWELSLNLYQHPYFLSLLIFLLSFALFLSQVFLSVRDLTS